MAHQYMKGTSLEHEAGKEIMRRHAARPTDSHRVMGATAISFGIVVSAYLFVFPKSFDLNNFGKDFAVMATKAGETYQDQVAPLVAGSKDAYEVFKNELMNGVEAKAAEKGIKEEPKGFPKIGPRVIEPIQPVEKKK